MASQFYSVLLTIHVARLPEYLSLDEAEYILLHRIDAEFLRCVLKDHKIVMKDYVINMVIKDVVKNLFRIYKLPFLTINIKKFLSHFDSFHDHNDNDDGFVMTKALSLESKFELYLHEKFCK